jgi:bifunctional non-homologous end joining protein LigD
MLTAAVAAILPGRDAVLDGEIVHLGPEGVPLFYDLMHRRAPQHYYAFDLLGLDGRDLRGLTLIERKAMLGSLVPPSPRRSSTSIMWPAPAPRCSRPL